MKKKSASRSAFFNIRVLIGLFVVLTGIFLALLGLGTFSGLTATSAQAQQTHKIINVPGLPPGFDCATIHEKGIHKMEGFRAGLIMIACGEATGGSVSPYPAFSQLLQKVTAPLDYGAADVDLVTGTETSPHIIQSETFTTANPDNPNQIVVCYNDSRGAASSNFSGCSASTDGGTTFTRVTTGSGQSPFANTFGDPVILYNKPTGTWFTVWLDGNGSCTLGGYKSTTPSDPNSWTHFCVHTNGGDDRESGWADNNPSSPFFGRMYVSWNNFNVGGGALQVVRSTDNGNTWSAAVTVVNSFVRNVQITGDPVTGDVYIAGMDEGGGGFPHNDTNKIFKSTDGGITWANTYTGTPFPGPGVQPCSDNSYFSCMFPDQGGFWRHEGWGEPATLNGVVHLVYAQHGTGADPGDVFYIRSTDGGVTFGAPFKLNSDSTTRPQWQPNISVSPGGTVFATWYDARESTSCTKGNPAVPCYRMWSRKSNNNGATWLPDDAFSDVMSPLPGQSDPNIVTGYAGDYDYGSALLTKHVTSWDDGRVAINNQSQQNTFFDQEPAGGGTPSPTPTASPSATATATATPTATPAFCSWAAGPSMPSVGARMVGVFFPANGKFYAMGGRSSDVGGSEFTHPFEYDPGSNTWTIKSATYPDNQVNNMACGILNQGGTDYIYCVGGSEVATQTATGRVFRYDPITDTISTVPANWPSGDQNFVPGGFSVYNNNMYILGGFNINVAMDDNIWQFDPGALVWTHKNAQLPTQLGYIPQATIGNLIYTGGGSTYDGTLLHDSTISLVYDPVADTIGNIAAIPRATAETRGLNLCNTMYVMGGGREAPNPSNEVDIYDPVANSWSVGTPFVAARRNFPTDTDGTNHIWLSGGYGTDGVTVLDSMEIFTCPLSPCGSPSPTPTATATATATGTPTATATATATSTPTATASATPTSTARPTPTPRAKPTPRPAPTPGPRPTQKPSPWPPPSPTP